MRKAIGVLLLAAGSLCAQYTSPPSSGYGTLNTFMSAIGTWTAINVSNAGTTGTTANTLTKLTGAPSTAVIAATTDTAGIVGITVSGAGTSGTAVIQTSGLVSCVFSNATTAGHYVQISSATGGDCADTGAATYPTSGQVIGRVLSTNGSAGTYQIDLFCQELQASTGGGASGTYTQSSAVTTNIAPTSLVASAASSHMYSLLWQVDLTTIGVACTGSTTVNLNAVYTGNGLNTLTLTSVANASGGTTVYTGTITGGGSNALVGLSYSVTGFSTSANNGGPWVVTASSTTTITLANASGVSETHAATAQYTQTLATLTLASNGVGVVGPVANGADAIFAKSGTAILFSTSSYTAGAACSTNPTYQVTTFIQ